MTEAELAAIEARAEGCTRGPWNVLAIGEGSTLLIEDATGYRFAQVDDGQNRKFIAHARTDIPALVAEVRRLRAQVALMVAGLDFPAMTASLSKSRHALQQIANLSSGSSVERARELAKGALK
jgi:hypothetical protein